MMTPARKRIFDFIEQYAKKHGFAPSYHEIAEGCGLTSLGSVHAHILKIEEAGYITREPNQMRSLVIVPKRKRGKRPNLLCKNCGRRVTACPECGKDYVAA